MSADRQRLTRSIQRIAKTDPEIRGLLDAADNKGGKPGAAGVGSSTDAESQRICCDGSVSSNPNPGTEERDPDSGGQTGLDPSDPVDIGDQGPGTLDGVTDCATGEPICFDGDGFIPPDGWDDPTNPPLHPTYEDGFFWETVGRKTVGLSAWVACYRAFLADNPDEGDEFTGVTKVSDTRYFCNRAIGGVTQNGFDSALKGTCAGQPVCDEEPPTESQWPEDGCINLAIKNGTIVGSKYDPENDGSYSAPRTSINLCDGSGNQISLAPAANGGWKTINSTTNNGYLYDSSGKQIAHIDGNEYNDPSV